MCRDRVVADTIVGEVIEDFQCEKPAWFWYERVPVEDGGIDDTHVLGVAARLGGFSELGGLERGEGRRDFDDSELRVNVDFGIDVADVIQDVEHKCAVTSTHFVDY